VWFLKTRAERSTKLRSFVCSSNKNNCPWSRWSNRLAQRLSQQARSAACFAVTLRAETLAVAVQRSHEVTTPAAVLALMVVAFASAACSRASIWSAPNEATQSVAEPHLLLEAPSAVACSSAAVTLLDWLAATQTCWQAARAWSVAATTLVAESPPAYVAHHHPIQALVEEQQHDQPNQALVEEEAYHHHHHHHHHHLLHHRALVVEQREQL
jgi:hypothetical protein